MWRVIRSCVNSHTLNSAKKITVKTGKSVYSTGSKIDKSNSEKRNIRIEEEENRIAKRSKKLESKQYEIPKKGKVKKNSKQRKIKMAREFRKSLEEKRAKEEKQKKKEKMRNVISNITIIGLIFIFIVFIFINQKKIANAIINEDNYKQKTESETNQSTGDRNEDYETDDSEEDYVPDDDGNYANDNFYGDDGNYANDNFYGDDYNEPETHHVDPHYVDSYTRDDGTEVDGYWRGGNDGYERSNPDGNPFNNLN